MSKSEPSILSEKAILEDDSPQRNEDTKDKGNKNDNDDNRHNVDEESPSTSLRSLSISIVTMANAGDSSIADSDSETEIDVDGKYVLHKLGQQSSFAPNSAELEDMNKGLKIICQHITPNGNLRLNNDLTKLENNTPIAGSSKIGSIALSNSTNVQFGDKHFYEGPVTIQQFLIENREKRKKEHNAAYDNPEFKSPDETSKNSDAVPQNNLPENNVKYFWSYNCMRLKDFTIITTGIIIAVITIASIFLYTLADEKFKYEDKIYISTQNGKFRLIRRDDWSARRPRGKSEPLQLPVHRVVIQHTVSPPCQSDIECIFSVQIIQNLHMDSNDWGDIGYNFLIGGEGQVIVGRDWDIQGAHTRRFNRDSIGIAVIGSFNLQTPSSKQIQSLELLLEWGVMEKKLASDYRLYGARQLITTDSPGLTLFKILKNFTHWSEEV